MEIKPPTDRSSGEGLSFETPSESFTRSSPTEYVYMEKWYLIHFMSKLKARPKAPKIEDVMVPLGIFLGTLLALLPADFQDYWLIDAATWEALAILIAIISGCAFVFLGARYIKFLCRYKDETEEELYEKVCEDMRRDWKKYKDFRQQDFDTKDFPS